MNRREVLKLGSSSGLGLFVASCRKSGALPASSAKLHLHTSGLLELPPGFHVIPLQQAGELMGDGRPVPEQPDGMACFETADGAWVLMRNHELSTAEVMATWGDLMPGMTDRSVPEPRVSADALGGVTRVVLDPQTLLKDLQARHPTTQAVSNSHLVLAGTDSNCSGGAIGGAWVSCEESSRDGHGFAYLTHPTDAGLLAPRPLPTWGRFQREAVVRDPDTGTIYMTEDIHDGCFYRFIPQDPEKPFGPGVLEALVIEGIPHTSPYAQNDSPLSSPIWPDGQSWPAKWVQVPDPLATTHPCRVQASRLGATSFYRGEGIAWSQDSCWFSASTGGAASGGQIFRFDPSRSTLTLELEVVDRTKLSCPDNLCQTPWGDLLMCEDNYARSGGATHQHLRCLTQEGQVFDLARNPLNTPEDPGPEFTGACFSPDGLVLFVNLQIPLHMTVAIAGPWESLRS